MWRERADKTHNFLSNSCNRVLSSSSKSLCRWMRGVRPPEARLCSFFGDLDLDRTKVTRSCSRSRSYCCCCSLDRCSSSSRSLSFSRSCSLLATSASTALDIYTTNISTVKESEIRNTHPLINLLLRQTYSEAARPIFIGLSDLLLVAESPSTTTR
jgi:hypothetical protein